MTLGDDLEIELGARQGPSGKRVPVAVLRRSAQVVLRDFPDLLEPAVQEAVLRLHRLSSTERINDPVAYGARVAHNKAIDLLKKEIQQRDIKSTLKDEGYRTVRYGLDSLVRQDLVERFLAALESTPLGERRRNVLRMVGQGYVTAEIAAELKVSRGAIYNDLKAIAKLLETLDPKDPTDPPKGGGGKSGLPRGDPLGWLLQGEAWRVAALSTINSDRPKEVKEDEHSSEGNRKGRCGDMAPAQRRKQDGHGRGAAAQEEHADLRELRRLLLQLPAFRDAKLAPPWSDEDGTPPRNLEEALSIFVDGRPS